MNLIGAHQQQLGLVAPRRARREHSSPERTFKFNGSLTSSDAVWDNGRRYDAWTVTVATVWQCVVIDMESDDVDA